MSNCNPQQNCIPIGSQTDPNCTVQVLSLDCDDGSLSISGGNSIALDCAVKLLETKTILSSVTLTGTILQVIYIGEDSVPQAKSVDLAPLITSGAELNVVNTNSILLSLGNDTLTASLNIDPTSTLPISASGSGIKFGCCPETPITANSTNTIQLTPTNVGGHTLTANLKYQSSNSILLSDSSNGLSAAIKYSTDANNVAHAGTDGAIFVQSASSQLANLANNGFVTTGVTGTLLVGSDSKLYRIADPLPESPITSINTNTVSTIITGPNSHTVQANVIHTNTNTVSLTDTTNGLQADVKIDSVAPGNVTFTTTTNGVVGNITESSIIGVQNTAATVQNPITKIYGNLNSGAGGYAVGSLTQYGLKFPSFTTSQRLSIPAGDLYDTLFIFDSTLRAFMWYDAVNTTWIQLT